MPVDVAGVPVGGQFIESVVLDVPASVPEPNDGGGVRQLRGQAGDAERLDDDPGRNLRAPARTADR